jgi:hypothetical protein
MPFTVTHTAYSEASPDDLWNTLTDLNNWPSWDGRLESVRSIGSPKAAAGGSYSLKPAKGNEITAQIVKAENGVLQDIAKLQFGTIETERSIHGLARGKGSLVTQTMRANINEDAAAHFAGVFWDHWSQGIIESTKALAQAPVTSAFLARHKNSP